MKFFSNHFYISTPHFCMIHRIWRPPLFDREKKSITDREKNSAPKIIFPCQYYFSLSIIIFPCQSFFSLSNAYFSLSKIDRETRTHRSIMCQKIWKFLKFILLLQIHLGVQTIDHQRTEDAREVSYHNPRHLVSPLNCPSRTLCGNC